MTRATFRLPLLAIPATAWICAPFYAQRIDWFGLFIFAPPKLALFAFLALGAALLLWARRSSRELSPTWDEVAIGLYFFIAVISLCLHRAGLAPSLEWFARFLPAVFLFELARSGSRDQSSAADAILVSASVVAAIALGEAIGIFHFHLPRAPISTLGSRNYVAAYLAIALPFLVRRMRKGWSSLSISFVLCLTVVVLARTRAAWLAVTVETGLGLIFLFRRGELNRASTRSRIGQVAGLALVAVLLGTLVPWPGLRWRDPRPYRNTLGNLVDWHHGSGRWRANQYRMGVAMLTDSPWFGIGPGRWLETEPTYRHLVPGQPSSAGLVRETPESDWLRLMVETGLLGMAALLWLASRLLPSISRAPIEIGLAVAGLAVVSAFDTPLFRSENLALFAVLIGLAAPRQGFARIALPSRAIKTMGAVLALLCLGVGFCQNVSFWISRGNASREQLERAQRWFPYSWRAAEIERRQGQ